MEQEDYLVRMLKLTTVMKYAKYLLIIALILLSTTTTTTTAYTKFDLIGNGITFDTNVPSLISWNNGIMHINSTGNLGTWHGSINQSYTVLFNETYNVSGRLYGSWDSPYGYGWYPEIVFDGVTVCEDKIGDLVDWYPPHAYYFWFNNIFSDCNLNFTVGERTLELKLTHSGDYGFDCCIPAGDMYLDDYYIVNDAPEMISAVVSPAEPDDNDMLITSVFATDAEDDDITYTYQWYQDGTILGGQTSSWLGSSSTSINNRYKVYVIPYDGNGYGDGLYSNSVTAVVPTCKTDCGGGGDEYVNPISTPTGCPIFVIPSCDIDQKLTFHDELDADGCQVLPTCEGGEEEEDKEEDDVVEDAKEEEEDAFIDDVINNYCPSWICRGIEVFQGKYVGEVREYYRFTDANGSLYNIHVQWWDVLPWMYTVEFDKEISNFTSLNGVISGSNIDNRITFTYSDMVILDELYYRVGDSFKIVSNDGSSYVLDIILVTINLSWMKWITMISIIYLLIRKYLL